MWTGFGLKYIIESEKEFGTIVSRFYQKKQRIAVAFCMVAIVLVK